MVGLLSAKNDELFWANIIIAVMYKVLQSDKITFYPPNIQRF